MLFQAVGFYIPEEMADTFFFPFVFRLPPETLFEMFHYLALLFRDERNPFIYLSWSFLVKEGRDLEQESIG